MARLGASYDDLAMMNPRIVYCSFSGYGQTGPYKDLPGHDLNFEALAGILAVTRSGSDPRPAIPGVPIADLAGAFNAALAIHAALRTRDRTGRGEFIDLSIYDTAVAETLAARFREKTLSEWERIFEPQPLPIAAVKRLSEVVGDPHVAARNLLPAVDIPRLGKRRVIAHPAKHAVTTIANPARVP